MTDDSTSPCDSAARDSANGPPADASSATGLVLGGGGARAAYQAGVLRYIGETFPDANFPIITGVSAGSINAAHLAGTPKPFAESTERLTQCWRDLYPDRVTIPRSLWTVGRHWLASEPSPEQSLFRTDPLRRFLEEHLDTGPQGELTGVDANLSADRLQALAVSTSSYSTMQTVTWVQGCEIQNWRRPNRVGIRAPLTIDHVMASTALPVLFPAVQLGEAWYGDGGLRLLDPLAPAIHLGANRLFVISTRYERSRAEADIPSRPGYPSPLQMAGILINVLLLDVLEHDAAVLRRINRLVRQIRPDRRGRLQPIDLLIMRPSVDLGQLGAEAPLPLSGAVGLAMKWLRSQQGNTPDWLSMLRFEPTYIRCLLEIGYEDAHRQHDRIEAFLARDPSRVQPSAVSRSES